MLDDPNVTVLRVSYETMNGTIVEPAITNAQRAAVSQHLGYRASDLIQANAIVWVEGPSDRVYLNHWIHARDPRLIEGVHYSVMFYGGRLLAHLTGEEMDTPDRNVAEFISLLQINRNMVIVIDSDKRTADTEINETKQRIVTEFKASGGIAWVTQGREIENYVPEQVFASATRASHPTTSPAPTGDQYEDRFASIRAPRTGSYEGKVKAPDKVRVAEEAVALSANSVWNCLDLIEQVDAVVAYLCAANDLPLATPSDGARGVPTWE